MNAQEIAKLQEIAQNRAMARIRAQAERGVGKSFPQPRNAAILADAVVEVLISEGFLEEEERIEAEAVIRAALQAGPLMQGSTLLKAAVKAGIYPEGGGLEEVY